MACFHSDLHVYNFRSLNFIFRCLNINNGYIFWKGTSIREEIRSLIQQKWPYLFTITFHEWLHPFNNYINMLESFVHNTNSYTNLLILHCSISIYHIHILTLLCSQILIESFISSIFFTYTHIYHKGEDYRKIVL